MLALPPLALWAYKDGPPPNMTGGFGGSTCHMCHQDNALNEPGGSLAIEGLPEAYTPGSTYAVSVRLRRPGLKVGGFQIASRSTSGQITGTWKAAGDRVRVAGGFVQHTSAGAEVSAEGLNEWNLEWTAPEAGEVVFHAAGNASNDDASALGDYIYTAELRVAAR